MNLHLTVCLANYEWLFWPLHSSTNSLKYQSPLVFKISSWELNGRWLNVPLCSAPAAHLVQQVLQQELSIDKDYKCILRNQKLCLRLPQPSIFVNWSLTAYGHLVSLKKYIIQIVHFSNGTFSSNGTSKIAFSFKI